jgi:hypothetical protein
MFTPDYVLNIFRTINSNKNDHISLKQMSQGSKNINNNNPIPSVQYASNNPTEVNFTSVNVATIDINPTPNSWVKEAQIQPPPNQGSLNNKEATQLEINGIRDYMKWSIINVVLGGLVLGIFPVLFSIQTHQRKRELNVKSAQKWSKITLASNIVITLTSIGIVVFLIIYFVNHHQSENFY